MKKKLPKVGMRMIKTVIAVLISAMIGFLRDQPPFYSMIAAVLCIQKDQAAGMRAAFNRTVGTLIGGIFGLLLLLAEQNTPLEALSPLYYLIVSLCLIPLIYITVLINKTAASYITCVVFLSITVSHVTDENPYFFVLNRVLDTLVGIFVALAVDRLIPYRIQKES
ncbi:MAG: FUSC family protein [Oscillospiraceae bacterium]|nr:FUSC family protein [Oscillospiraceae bacterium]